MFAKPWLRIGVNVATGDDDPADGDHDTFFNVLPTNHIYYGFADQLAFQNLWNSFVQLRLAPHPMLALNLFVHQFRLLENGRLALRRHRRLRPQVLRLLRRRRRTGYKNVGTEYDVVAIVTPHKAVTIEPASPGSTAAPSSRPPRERDVQFGYVAVELKY